MHEDVDLFNELWLCAVSYCGNDDDAVALAYQMVNILEEFGCSNILFELKQRENTLDWQLSRAVGNVLEHIYDEDLDD